MILQQKRQRESIIYIPSLCGEPYIRIVSSPFYLNVVSSQQ